MFGVLVVVLCPDRVLPFWASARASARYRSCSFFARFESPSARSGGHAMSTGSSGQQTTLFGLGWRALMIGFGHFAWLTPW